jgi:hypothetical protein
MPRPVLGTAQAAGSGLHGIAIDAPAVRLREPDPQPERRGADHALPAG